MAITLTDLGISSATPIYDIAGVIEQDWAKVNYAARPYLDAMHALRNVNDMYGCDSGESVVAYFLANANSWRGEVARAVKAELRKRIA